MINIQLVTLNGIAQQVKLCMSVGLKVGHAQNGHNMIDGNGFVSAMRNGPTATYQYIWQMPKIQISSIYPTIVPKKEIC